MMVVIKAAAAVTICKDGPFPKQRFPLIFLIPRIMCVLLRDIMITLTYTDDGYVKRWGTMATCPLEAVTYIGRGTILKPAPLHFQSQLKSDVGMWLVRIL